MFAEPDDLRVCRDKGRQRGPGAQRDQQCGDGAALASNGDTIAEHVLQAKAEGAFSSESPTTLLAGRTAHEQGMFTVMGGPNVVRDGSQAGNVAAPELRGSGRSISCRRTTCRLAC